MAATLAFEDRSAGGEALRVPAANTEQVAVHVDHEFTLAFHCPGKQSLRSSCIDLFGSENCKIENGATDRSQVLCGNIDVEID